MLSPRSSINHMRLREERAREIFQQFDSNADGIIDIGELAEMLTALGLNEQEVEPGREEEAGESWRQRMLDEFAAMDEDGSGGVDFPEFVQYYNKMLAYQSGEVHGHSQGGDATDFWGDDSGTEGFERLMARLLKGKKINQKQHDMVLFMLHSRYMILDIKIALASYKRAETILPLKRLLAKVGEEVTHRMTLSDKFWSMSPSEIQMCSSKTDELCSAGKITYDEKSRVHLLLENRFCMTELKAGFDVVFTTGRVSLLKQAIRVSYSAALKEHAKGLDGDSRQKRKVSISGNRQMEHLIQKGSIMDTHRNHVRSDSMITRLPAIDGSKERLNSSVSGRKLPVDGIGLHDRRFELAHKVVTHEKGHKVILPVLSHKRHSKEQYISLCKAADLFYSDSSPNTVEFDEDVLQKLLHVVDMLQKHNFLSNSLAAKAKEFVMKGDKYIVYALYKYDTNFDSLEAYLRYKMTDDERIQKEVGRTQKMLKRRKSLNAFMAERGEVLANARKVHAEGIQRAAERRRKSASEEEEAEAAADAEEENEAKREPSEPRWMLLYKAKFESYTKLLSA